MSERGGSGSGYWATQIGAAALFVVIGFGGGIAILAGDSDEKGGGVMLLLVGIAFLGTLIWLIRQVATRSREQRAVYAWVIMQLQLSGRLGAGPARAVSNDVAAMSLAARARDGKLSRVEILQLQALRPEVPFPARLPPATDRSS